MTVSFRLLSTGVALSLLLAGTAVHAQGRMPPGGEHRGQMGRLGEANHEPGAGLNVFFSPSGQPFRGKADEPYPVAAWIAQADTDHDGKISYDEFMADGKQFFQKLDVNHDNYISSPENTYYENKVAPEILVIDPRIDQPPRYHVTDDVITDNDPRLRNYVKTIQGASQFSMLDEPQPIRAADKNYDFRISGDEWVNATAARFKTLDQNNDGFLTANELPWTPAQQALAVEAKKAKDGKGDGKKKTFGMW